MTVDVDKFCTSLTGEIGGRVGGWMERWMDGLVGWRADVSSSYHPLALAELASNVLKPSLDILIYARRLQTSVGLGYERKETRCVD
jgi:hypothetical protein